ncbi:MAG TPA: nickel pincer cofactor biosynthesis protein LarC [Vicinamibacteria bacterium]|nr:nickel pincer cofactor biosynthesis protein LarC [Vicinamibacteria bacterium]
MSRIAYFDCASGASGDMVLGALVDLGLPLGRLRAELAKLPLAGYRLEARKVDRAGIQATKVEVLIGDQIDVGDVHVHGHGPDDEHAHDHDHDHEHEHEHEHEHGHAPDAHPHRGLSEILRLIEKSGLEAGVKERSSALFHRLGEAEASVHGIDVENVTFHEVGAVDSIVDVVGAVIGLGWLDVDRFLASPLNVGSGTVKIAHGVYPVPPPATLQLVSGVPVYGKGRGELLTPTGALLVTAHATGYGPLPSLRPEGVGYGAGTKDTPGRPNVLRLIVGEEVAGDGEGHRVTVIEAEMDDMSPQLFGPLLDRLLAAGALDAFYTPVQMKKGRPGVLLTVIAERERRTALEELLFAETTTLGVRWQEWDRTVLEREAVAVETEFGAIAVKIARRQGRIYNVQPEFDDCLARARVAGRPVKEVWAAALSAYHAKNRK